MRWARFLRCDVDAGFGMTYELVAKKRRKSATNPRRPRAAKPAIGAEASSIGWKSQKSQQQPANQLHNGVFH